MRRLRIHEVSDSSSYFSSSSSSFDEEIADQIGSGAEWEMYYERYAERRGFPDPREFKKNRGADTVYQLDSRLFMGKDAEGDDRWDGRKAWWEMRRIYGVDAANSHAFYNTNFFNQAKTDDSDVFPLNMREQVRRDMPIAYRQGHYSRWANTNLEYTPAPRKNRGGRGGRSGRGARADGPLDQPEEVPRPDQDSDDDDDFVDAEEDPVDAEEGLREQDGEVPGEVD